MLTGYMLLWSIGLVGALGLWRLRRPGQLVLVAAVTGLVLLLSQTLFFQLSALAGIPLAEANALHLDAYLRRGVLGWLALMVMPCGWLGPIVGLNLVKRLERLEEGSAAPFL